MTRRKGPPITCLLVLSCLSAPGLAQREQQKAGTVFRAGTRLVTVEVVVRNSDGPVTGLTSEDFTVLDRGRKQRIAVFSEGTGTGAPRVAAGTSLPLAPGAVSNRVTASGHQVKGATVLLFDQLNTAFENQGYARKNMIEFLQSAPEGEQIAVYMLGRGLHVVRDFTGDRASVAEAVRKWNPVDLYLLIQSTENMDSVDRKNYDDHPLARASMTSEAVGMIAQHMAGVPGRKSVIWLSDNPVGPGVQFLVSSGIHVYPVVSRSLGGSGIFAWMRDSRGTGFASARVGLPAGNELDKQRATGAIAAASGGQSFMDSRDITTAVRTAGQDAANTYVLGFYPSEEPLDNKFHALTVSVNKELARKKSLTIRYRPGYLATAAGTPPFRPLPVDVLLHNPLDATSVGLTVTQSMIDSKYQIEATVDVHDLSFDVEDGRHRVALDVSYANESTHRVDTHSYRLNFTDAEFAAALDRGLTFVQAFDQRAAVRVIVQDSRTGVAGSVRVVPRAD